MDSEAATAWGLAVVIYAAFFLLLFKKRLYYLLAVGLVLFAVGSAGLLYLPLFWLPVELVFIVADMFRVRKG